MSAQIVSIQEATVLRGQRAWSFIKKSAADQRQAWREVGEALAYGRAMHPSNQAFGKWVVAEGFDDIAPTVRSDAIWLAGNWASYNGSNTESHPTRIRESHRDSQADTPPTPELTLQTPSRLTASIEQVSPQAKTINKLAAMADRGLGQEKETAQRYLDKKAKGFGMETPELIALAARLGPAVGLASSALPALEVNLKGVCQLATELAEFVKATQTTPGSPPITREAALAIVLQTFTSMGI